jgi:hypothetical protein
MLPRIPPQAPDRRQTDPPPTPAPDLALESSDGVDLTLIRWMLGLTPLQRLELLQEWVDGLTELRRGRLPER